jgi:hypothetical protein
MKAIIALVILAAIAFGGYFLFGGSSFGISAGSPIGSFDKLDKYLTGRVELKKKDQPAEIEVTELNAKARVFDYFDELMEGNSGFSQRVRLMQDSTGAFVGLTGIFTTKGGSLKVEEFLNDYWQALAGAAPSFQSFSSGSGIFKQNGEVATFSKGDINGTWAKQDPTETVFIINKKK